MINKKLLVVILLSLISNCFSLTATLTNNSGASLENVKVTFAKADTTLYTNAAGQLNVEIITAIIQANKKTQAITPTGKSDPIPMHIGSWGV